MKTNDSNKLRLRSANEFSPGVVDLKKVLEIVKAYEGDKGEITEVLRVEFFHSHATKHIDNPDRRLKEQKKLANNVIIGLANYELINETSECKLTDIAIELLSLIEHDEFYSCFAKHILIELCGIEILEVIRSMQQRKETIGKKTLARALHISGFKTFQGKEISLNTTDHTKLLGWLRLSGVLPEKGYEINDEVYEKIAGIAPNIATEIRSLSPIQKLFLKTIYGLASTNEDENLFTKDAIKICKTMHGNIFDNVADQLAEKVFKPLEKLDWIQITGRGKGRGGKSGKIKATEKLKNIDRSLLNLGESEVIPNDLRPLLGKKIDEIYKDLKSDNTYKKGIALELLAYKIITAIGLTVSNFRLRGEKTGGAEVDLVCDGIHLHYSRWLVQCKNSKTVPLSVLAKEVGMALMLKANVILMITTGSFLSTVKKHADVLAATTNLQVILIDGDIIEKYRFDGVGVILNHLNSTASETMMLKKDQTEDIVDNSIS